jgi:hypothetical protein
MFSALSPQRGSITPVLQNLIGTGIDIGVGELSSQGRSVAEANIRATRLKAAVKAAVNAISRSIDW